MNTYETDNERVVLAEDFKSAVAVYHQTVGEYPARMELMKAGLAGAISEAMPGWLDDMPDYANDLYNILDNGYGELMRDYIDCLKLCLAEAEAAMAKFPTTAGVYEKVNGTWQPWQKPAPTALPPTGSSAGSGWIEWRGHGGCPVLNGPLVEVKFRNGEVHGDRYPQGWSWEHYNNDSDIVAYRVVKE